MKEPRVYEMAKDILKHADVGKHTDTDQRLFRRKPSRYVLWTINDMTPNMPVKSASSKVEPIFGEMIVHTLTARLFDGLEPWEISILRGS